MRQRLGVGCFGPLKQAYGRQVKELMHMRITHIGKPDCNAAPRTLDLSLYYDKKSTGRLCWNQSRAL